MFIEPMLLQKAEQPSDNDTYINELKFDGIRTIFSKHSSVQVYTRHNNNITARFPELQQALVPDGTILDGEIILSDSKGRPDFEALMSRFQVTNELKVKHLANTQPVTYCIFDILRYKDQDLTTLPLFQRKEVLHEAIPDHGPLVKVQYVEGNGKAFFEAVCKQGLEGSVQKLANSKYRPGKRDSAWLKVINYSYANVWITGYRKSEFGLLLAFENGLPAGVMELGVPIEARKLVYDMSNKLKIRETKDFVYIHPQALKCQVRYRNLTKSKLLRIPSFVEFVA